MSQLNGRHRNRRPPLIELTGPAGAGKGTLSTSPTFTGLWLHSRSPLWVETRHMVRLQTLHRALRRPAPYSDGALIFDEGPVFAMAWLRNLRPRGAAPAPIGGMRLSSQEEAADQIADKVVKELTGRPHGG